MGMVLFRVLCDDFATQPNHFRGEQVKILLSAAVVCNGDAQTIPSIQRRVGGSGNSLLMELHQEFLVQCVQGFLIHATRIEIGSKQCPCQSVPSTPA